MMKVSFLNLQRAYEEVRKEVEQAMLASLRSGRYIGGPEVEAFEERFADYVSARYCLGVANGLDALRLALAALDIGPGDEVIVPANTFIATWLAVSQCGARCVPVEPDPGTCNIDPSRIESAITACTRAIIPVHLYGQPADLDPILVIARRHGIAVVEDAAQAHGAIYNGRRIGAHGDIVTWSFYPGKNLGAFGDAGAITTNDPNLANRIKLLRNYGSKERYVNEIRGHNSRLDPVQAAALSIKLKYLDMGNARRRQVADRYSSELVIEGLRLPAVPNGVQPVWHLYCVRHERRDALRSALHASGIETLIHYPIPPHLQSAYADMGLRAGSLPIAEAMARELISLPIDPTMTDQEVDAVIAGMHAAAADVRVDA